MNTPKFSTLLLSTFLFVGMLFTSCDTTELITPEDNVFEMERMSNENTLSTLGQLQQLVGTGENMSSKNLDVSRESSDFELYQLIEFEVQRIYAHSSLQSQLTSPDEKQSEPTYDVNKMLDKIKVTGRGQGWSEELGRSINRFDLTVNPRTLEMEGILSIEFYPGEATLEFKMTGRGPIIQVDAFDGPHQAVVLQCELLNATGAMAETEINAEAFFLNALELIDPEATFFESYVMMMGVMSE